VRALFGGRRAKQDKQRCLNRCSSPHICPQCGQKNEVGSVALLREYGAACHLAPCEPHNTGIFRASYRPKEAI